MRAIAPRAGDWRWSAIEAPASRRSGGSWPSRLSRSFLDCRSRDRGALGPFDRRDLHRIGRAGLSRLGGTDSSPNLSSSIPTAVLATGGGAVLREAESPPAPRLRLRRLADRPSRELARRLEADRRGLAGRPALTAAGTIEEIAQVLA